jgi:hypothetical protein
MKDHVLIPNGISYIYISDNLVERARLLWFERRKPVEPDFEALENWI